MTTDPTEAEIATLCESIQSTWTASEARLRQHFQVIASDRYGTTLRRGTNADVEEFSVPVVSVRELEEAA